MYQKKIFHNQIDVIIKVRENMLHKFFSDREILNQ